MNDGGSADGGRDSEFVSFGTFDPLLARRIAKHLAGSVRFKVADASRVEIARVYKPWVVVPYRFCRDNMVELFVHREDADRARKIIEET